MLLHLCSVVEVDVVNTSQSTDSHLTFPSHQRQQHNDDDDDDDDAWKQSLGFIRLSSSNLVNPTAPHGNKHASAC